MLIMKEGKAFQNKTKGAIGMEEIMVTVYGVNELSEAALEKAYNTWHYEGADYAWGDENKATLEAFEDVFPINIRHWEYDEYRGYVGFTFTDEDEVEALKGIRLATYIYNNYYDQITKGKYYSLWSKTEKSPNNPNMGKLKQRYSKVITHTRSACPFTGYYTDDVILEPIWNFLEKPCEYTNFSELLEECFDAWVKACSEDVRGYMSLENFKDIAEDNEDLFYADGTRFVHH